MAQTLKQKTIGAIIWNLLDRGGQQVLQMAMVIVVANILCPDDYALVAMLAIFTAVGNLVVESGFGAALIQRHDADDRHYSSVFWFNLVMSSALYLLLLGCSPWIAAYFGEPQLVALSAVVFLSLPLNATMLIQTTLLNKQIRFRHLAKVNLAAMLVSSLAAIVMALCGCGVWTLAWQPVILAGVKSGLLWTTNRWRPQCYFSMAIIRDLFGFASSLLLSGLLNVVFINVYSLVIPRLYPKRELGLFTQGNKICDPIVSLVYGSIQNATYPIFSNIQNQHDRLINAYRKSIRFTSFLTFPLLIGGVMVAPALFRLLFKSEWWDAIPFFQLLCMGGCFTVLTAINNNFIKVSGRSSGILRIEIIKMALTAVSIALLAREGVLAMVAGLMAVRGVVHLINIYYTQRYTGYGMWAQLCDTVPYLLLAVVMAAAVWSVGLVVDKPWLLLPLQIVAGAAVYTLLAYATGSKILKDAIRLLLKKETL